MQPCGRPQFRPSNPPPLKTNSPVSCEYWMRCSELQQHKTVELLYIFHSYIKSECAGKSAGLSHRFYLCDMYIKI